MSKPECPMTNLEKWLKENLGPTALAPLTGTDRRALAAALHIIELYSYTSADALIDAFGRLVMQ